MVDKAKESVEGEKVKWVRYQDCAGVTSILKVLFSYHFLAAYIF